MKTEIIEKMSALSTAAFGLAAALAWNSLIQALFKEVFGTAETILLMFTYAVFLTIIAVVVTFYIGRASDKAKNVKIREGLAKHTEIITKGTEKLARGTEKLAKETEKLVLFSKKRR